VGKKLATLLRQQALGAIALFVALGGTSYAVATGSIGSREIKNSTIRGKDVKNNSLTGRDVSRLGSPDVRDSSLLATDFKPGQLPAGAQGPAGKDGAPGTARGYALISASGDINASKSKNVDRADSAAPGAGFYCINFTFEPKNLVVTRETSGGPGFVTANTGSCILASGHHNVLLYTYDSAGNAADAPFYIMAN
jgi:hypothetical protein